MLAQDWLYGERLKTPHDARVERHLKLPTEFNKHSSLAVLNLLAERIVYTDDIPTILYDMHENKQLSIDGMLSSAKLPYDCFWLEYNSMVGTGQDEEGVDPDDILENTAYGALVQRLDTKAVRMYIIVGLKWPNIPMLSTLAYVVEFNNWPPVVPSIKQPDKKALTFELLYAFNYDRLISGKPQARKSISDLGSVVNELIFGIFLVTQPRCYTDETIKWKASHKAKRAARDKPPLLEYRKIRLHICKPRKHYAQRPASAVTNGVSDTDSSEAVQHRRYHKVMGHFRHYINHDPPHTTWIEPHYRGDPALGVTFTERDVTR